MLRGPGVHCYGAGMNRALLWITVLAFALLGAVAAQASPTTYTINRVIGEGSVTGFIQTDGTRGVLRASNVVDWSLVLSDGTATFHLSGPLSGNNSQMFVRGADFAAFENMLFFNFSGIDYGILLFQQGLFSGDHYYCNATQPLECLPGETVVPLSTRLGLQNVPLRGNVVIGIADTAAPEPITLVLLSGGVGILVVSRKFLKA